MRETKFFERKATQQMTPEEMRGQIAAQNAIVNQLHQCGMRPLAGTEDTIVEWFKSRGCTLSAERGYLEVTMADGTAAVPSAACETLRREKPELFAADIKRDKICCKADLERGTPLEIIRAKSAYVAQHGEESLANLPKTREEAELRSAEVSPAMTRRQYEALSRSQKANFISALGDSALEVLAKIMVRKG